MAPWKPRITMELIYMLLSRHARLLYIFFVVCCSACRVGCHTNKHSQVHPADYAVVFPYMSDQDGRFLSHDLQPHSDHSQSRRSTRSILVDNNIHPNIFYKFHTPEKDFHLKLIPKTDLISKGFQVHHRHYSEKYNVKFNNRTTDQRLREERAHKSIRTTTYELEYNCFYQGIVVNEEKSHVALSLCNGMMGHIHTKKQDLLIQPLPQNLHSNTWWQNSYLHNATWWRRTQGRRQGQNFINHSTQGHLAHMIFSHNIDLRTKKKSTPFCGKQGPTTTDSSLQYADDLSSPRLRSRRSLRSKQEPEVSKNGNTHDDSHLKSRTLETLVVVDKDMVKFHGEKNVTTYVLTLLNMVSNLFNDNTIGNKINITLVALVLLEGNEPGLEVGHHADHTLTNFCQWQSTLEGAHHDHAILLTGVDICSYKDSPCDTLGFAPIQGMCKRYRSCTVNEDTGLGTAFTIAHEAGHNFGMFHDGEGNYCKDMAGSIMAPTLSGQDGVFKWSACSRKYLHKFLRSGQGWCLDNEPRQVAELRFPDKLPGELYDADIQCKWQFGTTARLCWFDFAKDLCKSLWCYTGGTRCETKFLPSAEGTSCGMGRWCRKGVCVEYGDEGPPPIDGGWSEYQDWTTCTRTCGGGVAYKERLCNNPRPQYGGADCEGEARQYKLCNMPHCPAGVADFRQIQCAAHNAKPFRGWHYTWVPYTDISEKDDVCRLYCQAVGYDFYFALSQKVIDGTRCVEDSPEICVEGVCSTVGCDHIVESGASLDRCGVCRGDNTTCDLIQGIFSDKLTPNAYHRILHLPRGSRSIRVCETAISPSYLAVRVTDGHYHLTGDWTVSWPGKYSIAGTVFTYRRPYNQPEELWAEGPLNQDVYIELLVHGTNPAVEYEYTIPKRIDSLSPPEVTHHHRHHHNYHWTVATSQCSVTCSGGEKVTVARCFRNFVEEVDEHLCKASLKPSTGAEPCNLQPCPPRWEGKEWSICSRSCGGGYQRRRVICVQKVSTSTDIRIRPRHCRHLERLPKRQECNEQECPPEWHVGEWTQCAVTCGGGVRSRVVVCQSEHQGGAQQLPASMCSNTAKPNASQPCGALFCPTGLQWFLSSWSSCSRSCGMGEQRRVLRCSGRDDTGQYRALNDTICEHLPKPSVVLREHCIKATCDETSLASRWFVSPWNKCSVSCGTGVQSRMVKCLDESLGQVINGCDMKEKPETSRTCHKEKCPQVEGDDCINTYMWCHLVPQNDLCGHRFYGTKCCQSCLGRENG